MKELDKVIFITGASRGIGEAITREFLSLGYKNFVLCCNEHSGDMPLFFEEVKNVKGVKALFFDFNLVDTKKLKNCVERAVEEFSRIDILINNAGIDMPIDFLSDCDERIRRNFEKTMQVNFLAPIFLTKHIGKVMLNQETGGSIVNIASTSGMDSVCMEEASYCASKSALINFTKCAAQFFQPKVRVNSVSPGWVKTEQNAFLGENFEKEESEKIYAGRFATPNEIASEVVFLATKATYTNGANRVINGGGSC